MKKVIKSTNQIKYYFFGLIAMGRHTTAKILRSAAEH